MWPLFCFILYVIEGSKPKSELLGSELIFFALKAVFAIKCVRWDLTDNVF